ncbi:DNA mismatch repair endonuclease MutL [Flavobacterium agricola]|uniref:DNA mismatch repair protein MutL n=1 Tax=Flavobacterium agricola TaxID=2870839 RepID=A0ABY6LVI3_9FLAO|nr:DNA mismatch repair endonuclease MutL [Flavobacterium agricola]UYW00337.1 DNA mismatch repair endonuclease MutL [Flavobacterium agricola]
MTSIIQLLPDHVANQIAAGEVVQRPASVVKELIENAVDAKATTISLVVKDAGKTLIHVVDNGKGMSVTDARMCFERHATSKIKAATDLFNLNTKGFRGEALASIAAIAHVELKTKQAADELGTHITLEGSKVLSQNAAVLPNGTSFLVKNLFYNIPARRKFLKSDTSEFRHIMDEFIRIALAHPDIEFTLIHNGSEIFKLPISSLRQRVVNIFGKSINQKLVPVSEETEIVNIVGFVTKPEFAIKSKNEQFFFINDRYIRNPYLHKAVMLAYDGILKDGALPSYFLFLDVPPESIDINIHPTKTEVKFDDEQSLFAILRSAVKHSLGLFSVANNIDFERDPMMDIPVDVTKRQAIKPLIEVDPNFNPFKEDAFSTFDDTPKYKPLFPGSSTVTPVYNPFDLEPEVDITDKKIKKAIQSEKTSTTSKPSNYKTKDANASWESLYVGLNDAVTTIESQAQTEQVIEFESDEVTGKLFAANEVQEKTNLTYQIQKKYILSTIKSGLLVIHQQRAHQRILYEQFLQNITVHKALSQQLLFPLQLYYSIPEMHLINELKPALENIGFLFDEINKDNVLITGIPVNVVESEVSKIIELLLLDFQEGFVSENSFSQADRIAKSMAKSLGTKSGTALTTEEQEGLVNALFACKEPNVSPFNQPTILTIDSNELDKRFSI